MHWFETLTGINPDGGNGTFEILLAALPMIFLAVLMTWRRGRRRARRGFRYP
jgi:hypothetical protein